MNRLHSSRYPWALVGLVGIVFAVEMFIAAHERFFVRPERWDWRYCGRGAASRLERYKLLCFGDSQVKNGVHPHLIEQQTGEPAYNLAPSGGTPATSYFLLRRALEAGAKPSSVVVGFHRDIIAKPPPAQATAAQWVELLHPREILELAAESRDPDFLAQMILVRLLPSAHHRDGLRGHLVARLGDARSPWNAIRQVLRRNWRVNAGAQAVPINVGFKDLVDGPGVPDPAAGWRVDPVSAHYIAAFFKLAQSRGIYVAWLLPPVSPGYQAILDRGKGDARFVDFVRETHAKHANVVVIDGRHSGYPPHVFVDVAHLDPRGASALSEQLAPIMAGLHTASADARERSIRLPQYNPRATAPVVENLSQSAVALGISERELSTKR